MASLIKKKKANTIYYYVVESARVDGKPRIVHQTYLGTAESVARLAQDRSAPIPLSATTVDFGLPGALWLAAGKAGVFGVLYSSGHGRKCRPAGPGSQCTDPAVGHNGRLRAARRAMACGREVGCLCAAPLAMAQAAFRAFTGALFAAGRYSSHLPAGAED